MLSTAPAHSAGPALTNANSSCSPVPSVAVTDGRCERRRVAVGNNQNGSARLWEQRRCSQRSSGWIPPWTSAGGYCSPGWQAAALAPVPGNTGCLERARGGLEQRFNLWFNLHLYWGVPGGQREPSPYPARQAVLLPLRAGTLPLYISSAFANHELMPKEPDEPPPGLSPQTSVTVTYGRGGLSPPTHHKLQAAPWRGQHHPGEAEGRMCHQALPRWHASKPRPAPVYPVHFRAAPMGDVPPIRGRAAWGAAGRAAQPQGDTGVPQAPHPWVPLVFSSTP